MRLRQFSILCAFVVLVSGCATIASLSKPEIRVLEPRITNISFQDVQLAVDLDIYNPYPFRITAAPSEYKIDIEDQKFLAGEIVSELSISPKQRGTLTVPARIAYADLARLGGGISKASELKYTLYGFVRMPIAGSNFDIPFSHRGVFPVLRPPVFSAVKVQLAEVSLSKAVVITEAEINNPNAFDLGLKELTYVLNLGNAKVAGLKSATEGTVAASSKGRVTLVGEISAASGLIHVLMNGVPSEPQLSASGLLLTPYGKIKF